MIDTSVPQTPKELFEAVASAPAHLLQRFSILGFPFSPFEIAKEGYSNETIAGFVIAGGPVPLAHSAFDQGMAVGLGIAAMFGAPILTDDEVIVNGMPDEPQRPEACCPDGDNVTCSTEGRGDPAASQAESQEFVETFVRGLGFTGPIVFVDGPPCLQ